MTSDRKKHFRPHRLMTHCHFQTVGAFLFPGKRQKYKATLRIVDLFDGDRLAIHDDQPPEWKDGDRIVILMHGFCGDHQSAYVRRLAHKLNELNFRTVRVDFRGFGDSMFVSKSHLYGGCSHDVDSVVREMHALSPNSNISLVGFSIGGNVLTKLLGEWGQNYPVYVDSAVAVSPPVDLVYAAWNIRRRGNQLYEANFVKHLKWAMTQRRRKVHGLLDTGLAPLPKRLVQWDEHLIAPIWGFKGAQDYYEQCSSGPLLKNIQVPTLFLWSKDDSIVPIDSWHRFPLSNSIQILETDHGGHLGFLSRGSGDPDRYWMDWRIIDYILERERERAEVSPPDGVSDIDSQMSSSDLDEPRQTPEIAQPHWSLT